MVLSRTRAPAMTGASSLSDLTHRLDFE
jgi:hypothetical protein